jgi:hypothetical protein
MKISNAWKLILLTILTIMLARVPGARADDIDPDADVPDIGAVADSTPPNSVLEIPQQCDQDSVGVLCDRTSDISSTSSDASATATATAANVDAGDSNDVVSNPNLGSVYDYANQNITNEASAMGTMSVPLGYGSGYPVLSPAPVVVSSGGMGPGFYQQWTHGPGSWQPRTPGPGYLTPMPLGYHPFGMGGGFGGGHFGRR